MAEKDLHALFVHTLKDIYFAETTIRKALPKMSKAAKSKSLQNAFEEHVKEMEGQVARLEKVFKLIDMKPQGVPCEAIKGILKEGDEVADDFKDSKALDAGLTAAAQAVEHYEIARYGALCTWAEELGLDEAATLIKKTLDEEEDTDQALTKLAESRVNLAAT